MNLGHLFSPNSGTIAAVPPYPCPKDTDTVVLPKMMRNYYPKMTRASSYLAALLETRGKPVLTRFDLFRIICHMFSGSAGKRLYLRNSLPAKEDYDRLRIILKRTGVLGMDRDYGPQVLRVLSVSDLPAEDIACLVDPTCYVSHLSAMQRWGLTDRNPQALLLTRPDRRTASKIFLAYMSEGLSSHERDAFPFKAKMTHHPTRVRGRMIRICQSRATGAFLRIRGSDARIATIGQTFLDMLQRPDLSGGMSHVLDVWEEHSETYLDTIVATVDAAASGIVKCRAGYILEERQGLAHPHINRWKAFAQRGGSRKLDPAKNFVPRFSEAWMISINA